MAKSRVGFTPKGELADDRCGYRPKLRAGTFRNPSCPIYCRLPTATASIVINGDYANK